MARGAALRAQLLADCDLPESASLLLGVGPTPTLLAVPMLVAALAVIAPVMLGALLSGRRPGTLGPASGILVGATALQVAVLVALG